MNIYIANVPRPPVPLYLAGAPLLEVFPIVPIMGNVPLGIGALSYAGQFADHGWLPHGAMAP
jgi:diacylglycerol O-acyltransferase